MVKQLLMTFDEENTLVEEESPKSLHRWCVDNNRLDMLEEWDAEKNTTDPYETTYGSIQNIWWKCKLGHSWQTTPNSRTSGHTGCPYCSGRRILPGFNDIATRNPAIAAEWNYERNGALKPTMVTTHSNKSAWWTCQAGHVFKAPIAARAGYNTGCPICNAERKTSFPEKAVFHYVSQVFSDAEENISFPWLGKKEFDIFIPSINTAIEYDGCSWHRDQDRDRKKDILCDDHAIRMIRIREDKCPVYESSSTKIVYGLDSNLESLGDAIRHLLSILLPENNVDVDVDRDYSQILERFITNVKDNNLATKRPDIAAEWDYERNGEVKPERVYVSSNKKVWWRCPKCGNSYRMTVGARTGSDHKNCPICAKKVIIKGVNDFASEHPELLSEWDFVKNDFSPDSIPSGSKKKAHWICPQGHSYAAIVYSRTSGKTGCPYCAHQKTDGTNSFGALYPDLLREWNYELNKVSPFEVLPASNKKYHWVCEKCGYHFVQSLSHRTLRHSQCPFCTSHVLVSGKNDLATQFPEVASEWNYERNTLKPFEVSGGSNKKYWWKCKKCGYEWEAVVASRTKRGLGCAVCSGKRIIEGKNDLLTLYPQVAAEWNYELNEDSPAGTAPSSDKKVWWKCSKGHTWATQVYCRTYAHCGCPYCSNRMVSPGENDLLTLYPEIATEWDYEKNAEKPSEVLAGSNKRFWFKCKVCGREWATALANRTKRHSGCPSCAGKKNNSKRRNINQN